MRTFKLFNFNLRSSAMVQADGCTTARQKIGVTPRTTSIIARFASVLCLILTMLFTLGVGEMGATTWTVAASSTAIVNGSDTWAADATANDMTNVSDNWWGLLVSNKTLSSTTYEFKVCMDHAWNTAYPTSNYSWSNNRSGSGYNVIYSFNNTSSHDILPVAFKVWRVVGHSTVFGNNWDTSDANNVMTKKGDWEYTLTKTNVSLSSGTNYGFKVIADEDYTYSYPGSDWNINVGDGGVYDVEITFNMVSKDITVVCTPKPTLYGELQSPDTWNGLADPFIDGEVSLELAANSKYEFKVKCGGTYYGYGDATGALTYVGQSGETTLSSSGQNICIATAGAGTYTFTYNNSTHKLSVTYPDVTHPSSDYVYFKNTAGWTNVKAHVFTGGTSIDAWPGPVISSFNFDGTNYYYAALGDKTSIIFSKSGDDTKKTGDLTTASSNKGKYYDYSSSTWKSFTATLSLDHQGATNTPAPNSVTVTYNATTNINSDVITTTPTKTGYTFGGYYTSTGGSGTQLINTSEKIPSDVDGYTSSGKWIKTGSSVSTTVYAKWTQTVTLHDNNGGSNNGSATATYNATGSLTPTAPTRTGYHIESADGYYAEAGCTHKVMTTAGALVNYSGYVESSKWVHSGATTLYAKWTANQYTITLNGNGGSGNTASVKATYDSNILSASITNPTKSSYTFAGWCTNSDGSGSMVINPSGSLVSGVTDYTDGSGNWVRDGNVILYARWKNDSNVDKYNFQYGSGTYYSTSWSIVSFGAATDHYYTVDFTMPDPASKSKYYVGKNEDFWSSGLGESGSSRSVETNITSLPLRPCGSAIGTATGATGKLTIWDNTNQDNLYVGFEPSGYAVGTASRNIALIAGADNFYYTDPVTISSTEASGNFQVKLKTSSSYTTCGHGTAENASTVSGRKITGDANIAADKKGVFQMWNNSTTNNFALRFVTVHDVTFNMQGHGSAISTYTNVRYNDKISAPTAPTATGYTFGGWYKEAGCTNAWNFASDVVTSATTLYAKWTANNYTVTLNNQSATSAGTETIAVTFDANTNLTSAITEPVKTGYAFGGYYTATGGGGTQIIDADGNVVASAGGGSTYTDASKNWKYANNIILYAKWTAVTTVAADPDLDICQVTGLFGLSGFANVGLNGGCLGATESISGKNTRHIYGQTEGEFRTLDLRNAPTRDRVHFEVWAAEAFTFTLKLAGWNSGWHYSGTQNYTTTAGSWKVVDVALSDFTNYADCFGDAFTGFILSNLGNKDIWFANVYLYSASSACAAEPAVAPSAPTYPACQVHSIYSDTYASIGMSYADWGSGSSKTDETVAGTNMYKVTVNNGNFGGLIINGKIDASSYEYIHMDVWTPLASTFRFSPICWNYTSSGNETEQYKTGIATTAATWTSVDIPVSYFTGLGLTMRGNYQLKIDQYTGTYFWITNIYYYNTSSCPSYTPAAGEHHFGTAQRQNVALYSDDGMATGRHANTSKPLAQRFDYYIVDCGEQMLSKVVTRGKLGTGVYDQMVQVWNNAKTAYRENKLSQHNATATVGFQRIGDADQYNWNGQTTTAPMNFYMAFQEQTTGLGYSEFFDYQRGYINNPNSDETAPTLTSVASTSETNWFTLTFTGGNDNSGQWFYYIEDTEFDYYKVSLEDTIRIPKVDNGQIFHFNCYAVDFNGNMSAAKPITIEMPYTSPSTTNLALNKPITIGAGSYATRANDGSLTSRMEGANSDYVNQWMYIDLRGYYNLSEVKIWFENASSDNFVLQAAHTLPATIDDDTQWRTIYTNTSTPNTGNAVGNVNTYDVSGSTARYIRFKSNHNTLSAYGFSIWEFEVYGSAATSKDATAPTVSSADVSAIVNDDELQLTLTASDGSKVFRITDSSDNVYVKTADASNHVVMDNISYTYCTTYTFSVQAMDAAANLSSAAECSGSIAPAANFDLIHVPEGDAIVTVSGQAGAGWQAAYAIDGNDNTYWAGRNSSGGSTGEQWININLGRVFGVSSVKVAWNDNHASNLYIEGSRDGSNYYILKHITTAPTNYSAANNAIVYETYSLESHIRVRHLRLRAVDLTGEMAIRDVQIFGSCNDDYNKPIITQADIYRIECSSSDAAIRISVSAFDETTTAGSITYKAVFTTGGLSDQTGLTPTDGIITVSGLTEGNTYALRIYAYDGTNYSENYKDIASFTPRVSLYYFTGDATGTTGVWEGALSPEESAAKRRFSATAHSGIYHFSISVLGNDQQYRLYNDVEGHLTYVNDNNHWSVAGNQIISGHNGETIDVYAKDKDHFVSNFDEVYVYGAAIIDATTEGSAVRMSYADNKFAWEGFVASGTNAFRIIVKENGSSFTDHSRARIMAAAADFVNSSNWTYAKLTFDMETWTYEWSATDVSTYIYDDHSGDGKWSTTSNWLSGALPTIEKDVIITKPVTVDITTARAKSVIIDKSDDNSGQLVLDAGKELVVATTVRKTTDGSSYTATGENDIVFNSTSGAGLGALAIGSHATANGLNNATVNFSTLSNGEEDNTDSDAQYVGTPFGNHPKMLYQFYNSWMYKFINTGVPGWTRVDGEDGLDAFQGYCIFSADGTNHVYWMQGTLVASEDQSINLQYNGGTASNPDNENMLANSWMAPIKIAAFQASDFTNADATIYIYNTGSPDDYKNNSGATSTGTQAGQYSLYTVNTCPTTAIIPSMQAFSVYTHGSTPSISLDYSKIVYDPAVAGSVVPGRNRAPQRTETDEPEKMRLYIGAESGYGDMLYMLEREDFAEGFENGWDGRKMFGEDVAPQLYAFTPDGNMAINCIPTFEGQLLGFRKGAQDNTYTFTFEYDGDNMWYLNDLKEQTSTLISAFDSYTFTSEADDTEARFIISRSPIHSTPTAVESATGAQQPAIRKIVINDHVFIIRNGLMYDVTGIMVR